MKTSLEIINKLSEKEAVKLDSQLVELGKLDDLKKVLEEIKGAGKNIASTGRKSVTALVNTTLPLIDSTRKKIEQAKKDYEIILKQTKDLGIDMPADITTNIKNAVAEDSDLFELRKSIEKYELQYLDLTSDF
jgi:prophage DNA circulation protein